VIGKATGKLITQTTGPMTQLLHSTQATGAITTTYPRINRKRLPHFDTPNIRACGNHSTDNFMPQYHGQIAVIFNLQFLAITEVEITIVHMHITVANATVLGLQQYLTSLRLWCFRLQLLQSLAQHHCGLTFHRYITIINLIFI
jgi:hypothetical protein